jgi:hypothetical protein
MDVTLGRSDYREKNLDAQDLHVEVQIRLLKKLRNQQSGSDPLRNPFGYAKMVTNSVINDYIRAKHPSWNKLKNRLRYFIDESADYATWLDSEGELVCGLSIWRTGAVTPADAAKVAELTSNPSSLPAELPFTRADLMQKHDWSRFLGIIVKKLGGPCSVDDLVSIAARALGAQDPITHYPPADPSTGTNSQYRYVLTRDGLALLWSEIADLIPWQRSAFLLNMPGEYGEI